MGIEKIGRGLIHTIQYQPKDETHKMIARNNSVRSDSYNKARWSQENETQRLKAESYRVSDINKIDRNGQNAPAPNVHHYSRSYDAKNQAVYMQSVGSVYNIVA